jgi:hypothetical protein
MGGRQQSQLSHVFEAFPEKEPGAGHFGMANLRAPSKALPAGTQNLQISNGNKES